MAEIIDLGNGRAMLTGYHSPYAQLHFDLKPYYIRRLYSLGYLSRDEYWYWLLYLGYSPEQVKWFYTLDSTPIPNLFCSEIERLK